MRQRWWIGFGLVTLGGCEPLTMSEPGNVVPRTVVEDPSLPAIVINNTRLHAETRGTPGKPVLIMLHGGPGADYRSLLPLADRFDGYSLAEHYFIVFWDQRGAGLSQRHDRDVLTIDQYDADLLAIVNRYAPGQSVTLVGHSWGGMYGTSFINRHPERVKEAVLIESGPIRGSTFERIKDDMYDVKLLREWLNDLTWSTQFFSADDHVRMDYQRTLGAIASQPRNNARRGPGAEPAWRNGAQANRYLMEDGQDSQGRFNFDFTTNLQAFRGRVLLIAGARSEVLGPPLQREQLPLYRQARLEVVAGAGHDVQWTHTAQVVQHMRGFFIRASVGGNQ